MLRKHRYVFLHDCIALNKKTVTSVFSLFSGAPASASVTPCVNWRRCWATWSLARWLASPRPSPSCWRRPCWFAAGWWGSVCQTPEPTSSCERALFTWRLPSLPDNQSVAEEYFFCFCLSITVVNCRLSFLPTIYCLTNGVAHVRKRRTTDCVIADSNTR